MLACGVALCLLASCGTQFAYNRLDWFTHYFLRNQVSLDGPQSRALRADLRDFFAWHRRSELPRYADFLDRFADAAARPISASQFDDGRIEIEGFVRDAVVHGAPDAARWLRQLRAPQVDELFASFEKDEVEARKRYCEQTPAERRDQSVKRLIDNVEDWTGRLRSSQRRLIASRLGAWEGDSCEDVSAQEKSRREFRTLVEEHRAAPDFAKRIAVFMTNSEDRWEADYRRTFEANRARYIQLLADLNGTLSPAQRARAVERLRGFARDLQALATEPRIS